MAIFFLNIPLIGNIDAVIGDKKLTIIAIRNPLELKDKFKFVFTKL